MAKPEQGGASGEQVTLSPLDRIRQARESMEAKQKAKEVGEARVEEDRGRAAAKAKEAAEFSKRLGEVFAEAGALETLTRFAERYPEHPHTPVVLGQLEIIADLANLSLEEWQEKYGGADKERQQTLNRAQKMLRDERFIDGLRKQLGEEEFGKFSKG